MLIPDSRILNDVKIDCVCQSISILFIQLGMYDFGFIYNCEKPCYDFGFWILFWWIEAFRLKWEQAVLRNIDNTFAQ